MNANTALARIYGYESPDDLMRGLTNIRHQLYVDPVRRAEFIKLMREGDSISEFEAQVYRKDGSIVWISESARAVRDAAGKLLYYEGMVADISGRKTLEAEQERKLQEAMERADRDPLTGLFNHRCFHKRLQQEADRATMTGEPLSIALIDLDNFKFFNDVYGHAVGDDVLRQVAAALGKCCRSEDVLARFGGDEFAMLMPGYGPEAAARTAERINCCLDGMGYRPPGYNAVIPFSLSVGVATVPDDGLTRFELIEIADARLRHVKNGCGEDDYADRLRASLRDSVEGFSMLDALVKAVDTKDRYTRRHSEDVMSYSVQIARELRLAPVEVRAAEVAGLLHDVGKIGVPDSILRKPGKLTEADMQAIKQHPMMGAIIVGAVPGFEDALDAVRHHHERWDGAGYPFGLSGLDIPLLARVMAVADAYSAMTTDRPYRKGMQAEKAIEVLQQGAGTQWDPECVMAFVRARHGDTHVQVAA
jgi:diguanylate cyclase (GGDEF)-like protein/PAS domain S-box-containing protein